MEVRELRHLAAPLGEIPPAVIPDRGRHVDALPAQVCEPPREVRVFSVEEEIRIKVPRRDLRALEGCPPVEARGPGRAGDEVFREVAAVRRLTRAPIEVTPGGSEIDARRVENPA